MNLSAYEMKTNPIVLPVTPSTRSTYLGLRDADVERLTPFSEAPFSAALHDPESLAMVGYLDARIARPCHRGCRPIELLRIFVLPEFRHRGFGTWLAAEVLRGEAVRRKSCALIATASTDEEAAFLSYLGWEQQSPIYWIEEMGSPTYSLAEDGSKRLLVDGK